jgi:cation:H+ antiporter
MMRAVVLLVVGLACLVKGADFLVNGASAVARRFGISEIVIGLTIVAFGTSAPELVVNIFASIDYKNELILGNVIGSNIFNLLLILGVAGVIYPLEVRRSTVLKEIPFSLAAVVLFFILANDRLLLKGDTDRISSLNAGLLLVLFVGFLIYTFGIARVAPAESPEEIKRYAPFKTWALILAGFVGLFLGGKLVVDGAVVIARKLQVSEKLIGLTIVSGGTSLPELATSAVAAYRRHADIAVGNIVGSNIFNILFIIGVSGLIRPIRFNTAFNLDLVVLALATLFLLAAMYTGQRGKLDRWEAAVLFTMYVAYLVFLICRE